MIRLKLNCGLHRQWEKQIEIKDRKFGSDRGKISFSIRDKYSLSRFT